MRWNALWFSLRVCNGNQQPNWFSGGRFPHDLVVGSTGVVSPSRLLHNSARYGLEVHQVVALGQQRLLIDPLQALHLLRVLLLCLYHHGSHVYRAHVLRLVEVLVQRVWRVDGVEFFRRIFAGVLEDDLLATGVF